MRVAAAAPGSLPPREQGAQGRGRKTPASAAFARSDSADGQFGCHPAPHTQLRGGVTACGDLVRPGEVPAPGVNQGALIGKQQ